MTPPYPPPFFFPLGGRGGRGLHCISDTLRMYTHSVLLQKSSSCSTIHTCLPYGSNVRCKDSHGLRGNVVAGDDLLEGVQEEILPFGVLVDLREDEGEVALEVSSAHTPYMEVTQNEKIKLHCQNRHLQPKVHC